MVSLEVVEEEVVSSYSPEFNRRLGAVRLGGTRAPYHSIGSAGTRSVRQYRMSGHRERVAQTSCSERKMNCVQVAAAAAAVAVVVTPPPFSRLFLQAPLMYAFPYYPSDA